MIDNAEKMFELWAASGREDRLTFMSMIGGDPMGSRFNDRLSVNLNLNLPDNPRVREGEVLLPDPYIKHCERMDNDPGYARDTAWVLYTQGNGVFYA